MILKDHKDLLLLEDYASKKLIQLGFCSGTLLRIKCLEKVAKELKSKGINILLDGPGNPGKTKNLAARKKKTK